MDMNFPKKKLVQRDLMEYKGELLSLLGRRRGMGIGRLVGWNNIYFCGIGGGY